MKNAISRVCIAVVLFSILLVPLLSSEAQGTAFSYQGMLIINGKAANGNYDMAFSLFSSSGGGIATAGPITNTATDVSNGLFVITIDFGTGVFNGTNYWLDISVSPSGSNMFTELTPRQVITPNPYTIYSENAGRAATASTASIAGSANSVSAANIVGTMQVQQLPVGVVMNNQKGVTLSGVFNGNGGGLTNLPSNAALLNSSQTFSGVNIFSNQLVAGIPPITASDNFVVRPVANRWLGITPGWITSGMVIESVNDALTANIPLELRGNPTVFTVGNTGFGTTNPFRFVQVHPAANLNLGIYQSSLTSGMTIENVNDANTANEPLEFRGSPNVFTTGNVGIGTTNPTNALVVNGTISMTGNLNLPSTTASSGIIYSGGNTLIHAYGSANFFAGQGAGNLSLTGSANVGIGLDALLSDKSGSYNTANGNSALLNNTTGNNNTAVGTSALQDNTNGFLNTAVGSRALQDNSSGSYNTATGNSALLSNTSGSLNTAVGTSALQNNTSGNYNTANGNSALLSNVTGNNNTAVGTSALQDNTNGVLNTAVGSQALQDDANGNNNTASGSSALLNDNSGNNNTADGSQALENNTSGSFNIALGYQAGANISTGSSNIDIGSLGVSTDTNIIRIGTTQTATYLAGTIYANGVALTSDRNAKENFKPVDSQEVLSMVASLPVTEWNYKQDSKAVQHIGPMAQDFQAAFGLDGNDDKHISMVDEGGVALAAIQGLNQKLEQQSEEKDAEIRSLKQSVSELKQLVQSLAEKK